jgi:ABC-type bacteriocin/lantibiotic exporters, contain an N-terminal double-glycine peptidase domain
MVMGTMLIGAYLALNDPTGYMVGGLFAFMMLSQRVAQPLVGLARLVEDYEEVGAAIGEAGAVLNHPMETDAPSGGLRPRLDGPSPSTMSPSPIRARRPRRSTA